MNVLHCLVVLALAGSSLAFAGQFIPKSFYVIDHTGHKSDVVYLRNRRDIQIPIFRVRRGGGSQASASSHASASSSSGSGFGGGGDPIYFGGDYNPGISDGGFGAGFIPNLENLAGGNFGGGKGGAHSFASSSSSSSSGTGGGHGGGLGSGGQGVHGGYSGPTLFSRFGEDVGSGVKVSGSAQGEKGAFSSSSTSIDSDGKIKYSVQSGKY